MNIITGQYDKEIELLEKQTNDLAKKIYNDIKLETRNPKEIRRKIDAEKNANLYRQNRIRLADTVFNKVRDLLDEEIEVIQLS